MSLFRRWFFGGFLGALNPRGLFGKLQEVRGNADQSKKEAAAGFLAEFTKGWAQGNVKDLMENMGLNYADTGEKEEDLKRNLIILHEEFCEKLVKQAEEKGFNDAKLRIEKAGVDRVAGEMMSNILDVEPPITTAPHGTLHGNPALEIMVGQLFQEVANFLKSSDGENITEAARVALDLLEMMENLSAEAA